MSKPKENEENLIAPGRKRSAGLGRGLNALLGDVVREEPLSGDGPSSSGVRLVAISDIQAHPGQPRRYFEDGALDELAQSIARRGVIQPIIVRPSARGRGFQLVAGERRWRAAQRARLHEIPAIIRDLDDAETLAIALIENIQREDLNPVEEARAYRQLMADSELSHKDIAKMVDKSRSHVVNLTRLLNLPDDVLDLVIEEKLSMGHARALINCEAASELADKIVSGRLSVRETEKLVRKYARGSGSPKPRKKGHSAESHPDIAAVERHLEDLLGLKVKIATNADSQSGSVAVQFSNLEQLDLVCQRLSGDII